MAKHLEHPGPLVNKRVRFRGQTTCGTVIWDFAGETVGVIWDAAPRHVFSAARAPLVIVEREPVDVPEECRPMSYGALAVPERRSNG